MSILSKSGQVRMSREEFERLPEGPPFYDYVDGEAIEVNRPTGRHQDIVLVLAFFLREHCRRSGLGRVFADIDVELDTGDVFGPDMVFLSRERGVLYDEVTGDLRGTPDLVVEVLSPATVTYDRLGKMDRYAAGRVPWVWLIDQENLDIEEYAWTPAGYRMTAKIVEGEGFRPGIFPGLDIHLDALIGGA